ncbi:MAG: IS4 family transposase [candidate division Zixibacteria bacterium]|nr:IS4 family transposase [candidate division Zixibacteria bacterium]
MYNNTKLFIKVLRFISKPKFNALVQKFQTDKHYRKFFSYQHLLAFVFAQFNNTTSLRELNWAMHMNCNLKRVLHFDSLNLSSLSRANDHRSYRLFENIFFYLLIRHASNLSNSEIRLFKIIDGTFLTLSSKLFSWANPAFGGAVKLTFCLDLSKEIPEQVIINVGEADDNVEILKLNLHPGFTYIFDRGYCSHEVYSHFNENHIFFITRLPAFWSYEIKEEFPIEKGTNILSDELIKLGKNEQMVKGDLRLITLINDKDEIIQFLTNRFDLKAEEIAEIYRKRWEIELFFRWVKQYLRIKRFLGTTPNAVYSQIYIALITYLLTVLFKLSLNCKLSNLEIFRIIKHNLFQPIKNVCLYGYD